MQQKSQRKEKGKVNGRVNDEAARLKGNKALVQQFVDGFFNRRNLGVVDELFSPEYVHHTPDVPSYAMNFQDYRKRELQMANAFPDFCCRVEDQIAEGDRVTTRLVMEGTQTGNLPNIPATGRKIEVRSIVVHRIENGKFKEGWEAYDSLGMMMQLDVIHMVTTLSKERHERGWFPASYY
ncbi:MAG TPA: ester cyclase [Methanocella sp.]|nr:ester cyclase [Methanocella sp.]